MTPPATESLPSNEEDNVDFFDAPSPETQGAEPASPASPPTRETMDNQTQQPVVTATTDPALGDNIELF